MSLKEKILQRPWVAHLDDEREIGNSIIVTLKAGYTFVNDPGCGVMGFDTMTEAYEGTRSQKIAIGSLT